MKPRFITSLIVFWPWIIIAFEYLILLWALARGCKIWARGPEVCMVLGYDIGEQLYPIWTIRFQMAWSLMWVIPAAIAWVVIEVVLAVDQATAARQNHKG